MNQFEAFCELVLGATDKRPTSNQVIVVKVSPSVDELDEFRVLDVCPLAILLPVKKHDDGGTMVLQVQGTMDGRWFCKFEARRIDRSNVSQSQVPHFFVATPLFDLRRTTDVKLPHTGST